MSKKRTFLRNSRKAKAARMKQRGEAMTSAVTCAFWEEAYKAYQAGQTTMQIPPLAILAIKIDNILRSHNIPIDDYSEESQALVADEIDAVMSGFFDEHDCSIVDFTL